MNTSETETLNLEFENVKKNVKDTSMSLFLSFILSIISGLICNFIWYGLTESKLPLWIIGIIIVSGTILFYGINYLWIIHKYHHEWDKIRDKKIDILNKENKNLKEENKNLKDKGHNYREAEIVNINTNIENFMKDFVEHTQYVDAIQIHNYDIFSEEGNAIVSINFEKQYLREAKNHYLNAMTNYYKIDINIFRKFYEILNNYNEELKLENSEKLLSDIDSLMSCIIKNKTEENIRIYKILCVISTQINKYIGEEIKKVDDTTSKEIAYTITKDNIPDEDKKRTGILGGVLLGDGYAYAYNKRNELKTNRKYYSFCDSINGEEKEIITIIVDTSLSFENGFDDLMDDILKNYKHVKETFKI